jgi:hypothetical protein
MDMSPVIVLDTRTPGRSVSDELDDILGSDRWRKTVFIVQANGLSPVLTEALSKAGSAARGRDLRLTCESELIPLLKWLGLSRTVSPDDLLSRQSLQKKQFRDQRNAIRRAAVKQAAERRLDVLAEAKRFAADYGFADKDHTSDYLDAAMGAIERYPPELGMAVISEFSQLEGYKLAAEVITAMSLLDQEFSPSVLAYLGGRDEIRRLVDNRSERIRRAAATIARLLFGCETLEGALAVYKHITDRPLGAGVAWSISDKMKQELDAAILELNPVVGAHIIGDDDTVPSMRSRGSSN